MKTITMKCLSYFFVAASLFHEIDCTKMEEKILDPDAESVPFSTIEKRAGKFRMPTKLCKAAWCAHPGDYEEWIRDHPDGYKPNLIGNSEQKPLVYPPWWGTGWLRSVKIDQKPLHVENVPFSTIENRAGNFRMPTKLCKAAWCAHPGGYEGWIRWIRDHPDGYEPIEIGNSEQKPLVYPPGGWGTGWLRRVKIDQKPLHVENRNTEEVLIHGVG